MALVTNRLQGDSKRHQEGALGRHLAYPTARHGTYHIWVGPVGQPQCPQVELLLELGLSGVQEHEPLPDLPALCPQTLILGVLGAEQAGSAQDRLCVGVSSTNLTWPCWQNLCGRHLLPLLLAQHPEFPFGNPRLHMACPWGHDPGLDYWNMPLPRSVIGQRQAHDPSRTHDNQPQNCGWSHQGSGPLCT